MESKADIYIAFVGNFHSLILDSMHREKQTLENHWEILDLAKPEASPTIDLNFTSRYISLFLIYLP